MVTRTGAAVFPALRRRLRDWVYYATTSIAPPPSPCASLFRPGISAAQRSPSPAARQMTMRPLMRSERFEGSVSAACLPNGCRNRLSTDLCPDFRFAEGREVRYGEANSLAPAMIDALTACGFLTRRFPALLIETLRETRGLRSDCVDAKFPMMKRIGEEIPMGLHQIGLWRSGTFPWRESKHSDHDEARPRR